MNKIISKNKLLATTAICSVMLCAESFALSPTLDTLKTQSTTLSGSYVLTELGSNTLPEGASKVKIGDTVYYFTPSGDDADLLKTLAGTSAGNLVEDANGVFDLSGTKYGFNVSAIPDSVFSYGPGDETNYHFITQEANDEGVLTTSYHTISLKPEKFSTSQNIKWTSVDEEKKDEANVIAVNLPNDDVKYFQYTYTQPSDYTEIKDKTEEISLIKPSASKTDKYVGLGVNNPSEKDYGDVDKFVFSNNKVTATLEVDYNLNKTKTLVVYGGAISNRSIIGDITGDFLNNSIEVKGPGAYGAVYAYGGAIYSNNGSSIGNITGNFIGNYVYTTMRADGGAIYNSEGTIGKITGDFISNYSSAGSSYATGGAINNRGTISSITGDFIGNYAYGYDFALGGAIYNYGTIGDITGDFIGNYAEIRGTTSSSYGGAIYNSEGTIGNITGDFIGNKSCVVGNPSSAALGGAIYNSEGTIGDITGDFIGNIATRKLSSATSKGGAIYNSYGTIGDITGDFIGNSAALGGAIYNSYGTIGDITGDFINNPNAIDNQGTIGNIVGNFIDNYKDKVIYNNGGKIGSITGNFLNNTGRAIFSSSSFGRKIRIGDIDGNFINGNGGAIYNFAEDYVSGPVDSSSEIGNITGSFIGNHIDSTNAVYGGAIDNVAEYNYSSMGYKNKSFSIIGNITGNFISNYLTSTNNVYGGAISNRVTQPVYGEEASIANITGDFINNYIQSTSGLAYGGAVYSTSSAKISDITGDFIGNYAKSISGVAYGGAIYSTSNNISLSAKENGSSVIKDNYVEDKDGKRAEAIYMGSSGATLTLQANKNGTIEVYDIINGSSGYGLNLTGDGTGSVSLFNDVLNAKVTANNVGVNLSNGVAKDYTFNSLTTDDTAHWNIDVNLTDKTADNITSSGSTGTLYIDKINNIGSTDEEFTIQILKNTDGLDNLQLALNEGNIKVVENVRQIDNEVYYSKNYVQEEGISLDTTSTLNDSIRINKGGIYDALVLINDKETDEERSFVFDIAGTHTLNQDLLATTEGVLNIEGFNDGGESSVINANGHSLFSLDKATTLNINGVTLSNASGDAIKVSNLAELNLTNVLFENNGANAISSFGNVNINAKDTDIAMSENISMTGDATNNISLSLKAENGALNLANEISGSDYNLYLKGGDINVSGSISGANNLEMASSVVLGLGTDARINVNNMFQAQETSMISTVSASAPSLKIDANIANDVLTTGSIDVNGDVSGTYNVIVNALSTEYASNASVFLTALQDDATTASDFNVFRVENSPYVWETVLNAGGETEGSTWYLSMKKPLIEGAVAVVPEVIASSGVTTSGLSQTNGMIYNIMRKVNVNQVYCPGCGFYDYNWDGKSLHNAWADTTYNGLKISAPVEIEANVWGLDAGADIQQNLNNKLGVFASYRKGNYEMSGKGEKIYSTIGSEVDIDSYLAGLYYRFDKNNWYAFATVYGGLQNAEIKTDDGVKSDTDGTEFGASAEMGYNYALNRNWSLTPSLAAFYSQIDYDDATDNAGKTVKYNNLKQVELEAGLKLAHTKYTLNGFYAFHIKPSVVQTLVDGDEINVEELGKVETVDNKTLGRVEVGGTYGFADRWSAYGWSNYTFGSDYDAVSLGLGLNYAW